MKSEKVIDLEFVASLCHEVNRSYCQSIGDYSQESWKNAPDWQKQSALDGVRFHFYNDTTPADSHINWMKDKIAAGWIYGEVKDTEKKIHPCIVEYDQLPQEQRSKDYIFKAICDFYKHK